MSAHTMKHALLNNSAPLGRHAPSARRFDFAVTVCVIGLLATWLLHSLNAAQHEIEKVTHQTALNNMRLGMAEAWIHHNVANTAFNVYSLVGTNPMQFIAEKPSNYVGEYQAAPSTNQAIWYFNTQTKQLIYVYSDGEQITYRLVLATGQANTTLNSISGLSLVPVVNTHALLRDQLSNSVTQKYAALDRNEIHNFLD